MYDVYAREYASPIERPVEHHTRYIAFLSRFLFLFRYLYYLAFIFFRPHLPFTLVRLLSTFFLLKLVRLLFSYFLFKRKKYLKLKPKKLQKVEKKRNWPRPTMARMKIREEKEEKKITKYTKKKKQEMKKRMKSREEKWDVGRMVKREKEKNGSRWRGGINIIKRKNAHAQRLNANRYVIIFSREPQTVASLNA